jgi:hypothetical protein
MRRHDTKGMGIRSGASRPFGGPEGERCGERNSMAATNSSKGHGCRAAAGQQQRAGCTATSCKAQGSELCRACRTV